jgi:hypothetical protein
MQMSEEFADQTTKAQDGIAIPEIVPGFTVEKPSGKYTVTAVVDGRVKFERKQADGTINKGTLPQSIFTQMVIAGEAASRYGRAPAIDTARQRGLDELSVEDLADFRRLDALYRSFSEGDRLYIIDRWDREQGMDPPHKRLEHQRNAPRRQRRRRIWTILALIPAALFCWWFSDLLDRDRKRSEDSYALDRLRERAKANPALKSEIDETDRLGKESQRSENDVR